MTYQPKLQVYKLEEAGYNPALIGLGFNFVESATSLPKLVETINSPTKTSDLVNKMRPVALKLCGKDGGHNKFLESIFTWSVVIAPRYMWQQMDTYRQSTKQSQATMVLCNKRELRSIDFEEYEVLPETLDKLNELYHAKELVRWKRYLAEGFLQARLWVMNYKCLRNIIIQRREHKLEGWIVYCESMLRQVDHQELLPKLVQ